MWTYIPPTERHYDNGGVKCTYYEDFNIGYVQKPM